MQAETAKLLVDLFKIIAKEETLVIHPTHNYSID
jgi:hypothetical protein